MLRNRMWSLLNKVHSLRKSHGVVRRSPSVWARPSFDRLEARDVPANFFVTNGGDSGPGSLRQAILDAQASPGGPDSVIIQPGFQMITLTSALPDIVESVIDITGPVGGVIVARQAPMPGVPIPQFRIFTIVPAGTFCVLSNLTISNGSSVDGGGIWSNANLTMNSCTVTGCIATNNGGGIYSTGAPAHLTGCTISNNFAGNDGGGVYFTSSGAQSLTLDVAIPGVTPPSSVIGNTAQRDGGGIWFASNASLLVSNTGITLNNANTGRGGGVFCLTCWDCIITGAGTGGFVTTNFASQLGGGIYAASVWHNITVTATLFGNAGAFLDSRTVGGFALLMPNATAILGPFVLQPFLIQF